MSSSSSSTKTKDIRHFLTSPSTYWVTLVRLGLILIPSVFSSSNTTSSLEGWLYDGSVLSVLIRPHESLPQLEEAHAVWSLAALKTTTTTKNFSTFYVANHSVRIPPLVLAFFSRWTESGSNFSRICFSLFLLLMDILISYLIEQIGMRLLGLVSSPSRPTNGGDNTTTTDSQQPPPRLQALITEEEDLQRKLPECIRPKYAHIFPIYTSGDACQESAIPLRGLPLISAKLYYWSPFTAIPSSLLCCWQNIPSLFLLASVHESICSPLPGGSVSLISFYLAVATYLEPHHIAYLIPILLLRHFQSQDRNSLSSTATVPSKWDWKTAKPAVVVILFFALWLFLLHGISCSLVGGLENYWSVLGTMYGSTWLTASPNLSLQWYFRMQIFSRFRDYFGAVYAGIPFVLVGPLCLRFYRYPGLLLAFFVMMWTVYRPVQVLYDANFAFCFLLFCPKSLARMGYAAFIALVCLTVPAVLNIVDHWMWLDANNGNANYIFFMCLAYNVFLGVILGQFTSASMQRDKALRLMKEKGIQ